MLPRVDLIRTQESDWALLATNDVISNHLKRFGQWGQNELTLARMALAEQESFVVLDIGANLGGFTVPIAKFVDSRKGKVFAFEPQRLVFQQLCANVFINRLDNVYALQEALGDQDCLIELPEVDLEHTNNVGGLSADPAIRKKLLQDQATGKDYKIRFNEVTHKTRQIRLDSFEIDAQVSFIKLDVEGCELAFFRGAAKTLEENGFPPIFFEQWLEKPWFADRAKETNDFLLNLGYEIQLLSANDEAYAQHPKNISCPALQIEEGKVFVR